MSRAKACGLVLAAWVVFGSGNLARAQQGGLPGGWSEDVGYQHLGLMTDAAAVATYTPHGYAVFDSFGGYASPPNTGIMAPQIPIVPPQSVAASPPATFNALVPLGKTIERKTVTRRRR
jgi:hypothetical protein